MSSINPFNRPAQFNPGSPLRPVIQPRVHGSPSDLDSLAGALESASKAINDIKSVLTANPDSVDVSSTIASHIEAINQAANAAQAAAAETLVIGVSPKIDAYDVQADLALGEKLDITVEVVASATSAGLSLSFTSAAGQGFGWNQIDLAGPDAQFKIEVSGPEGVQVFSFASGTTSLDMATSISAFADQTGVTAGWSPIGLTLSSTSNGPDSFVSVKVLDHGGAKGQGIIDGSGDAIAFESTQAGAGITDNGEEPTITVNGDPAEVDGNLISFESSSLSLSLVLNDFSLGEFRALRLLGGRSTAAPAAQQQQQLPPPPPAFPDQAQALREAIARGAFGPPPAGGASLFGKAAI